MSFNLSIIGIDGSGKSTVTLALASLTAAEFGLTTIAISDDCWGKTPEEDLFRPDFRPTGQPLAARLDRLFRKAIRAATHQRRLYPTLKVIQLALHEWTARRMETIYRPDLILSDGNLLLTSGGWVLNYMSGQVDPAGCASPADLAAYIDALYAYIAHSRPLPPEMGRPIPGLKLTRHLRRWDRRLKLGLTRLPDALILLDLEPDLALARITARDQKPDGHENQADLSRARMTFRAIADFFSRRRGPEKTATIDVTRLSVGQTLIQAVDFVGQLGLRPRQSRWRLPDRAQPGRTEPEPSPRGAEQTAPDRSRLGTSPVQLTRRSAVARKVLTFRYLIRYLLLNLYRGSGYELFFPLSQLGQLSLREGYSAALMRAIYRQDSRNYGWPDRLFLAHPLHRAVYHRLQVLQPKLERELGRRLANLRNGETIKILSAPSGYAVDLLPPLAHIAKSAGDRLKSIQLLASDLDPDGRIEQELIPAAQQMGLDFEFARGDLTSTRLKERFRQAGPFDLVVFIGLSSWISKTDLVDHLKLIRTQWLAPGGVLFTDCFSPQVSSLSGKYMGYKASYYGPAEFSHLLAYGGFDPADLTWESSPEGIDHVCLARAPGTTKERFRGERRGGAEIVNCEL